MLVFLYLFFGVLILIVVTTIYYIKYKNLQITKNDILFTTQETNQEKKPEDWDKILNNLINKYQLIIIFDNNGKIIFCSEFFSRVFRTSANNMKDLKRHMKDYMPYDSTFSEDFFNFDYISYLYTDFSYYIVNAFQEEVCNVIILSDISACAYEVMLKELVQEINLNILSLVNEMIFVQNKHRILLNNCVGKINPSIFMKDPIHLSYGYEGYVISPFNFSDILSLYKESMDSQIYYKLLNSVKLQKRCGKISVCNIQEIVYSLVTEFNNIFHSNVMIECVNLNMICKVESLSVIIERLLIISHEQCCEIKIYGHCIIKLIGLKIMDDELENALIRNGYNFTYIQSQVNELLIILDIKEIPYSG